MVRFSFSLFVFVLIFCSCHNQISRFDQVCRIAQDNSNQLQMILEHYEGEEQKQAAAKFLLNNMFHFYEENNLSEIYRANVMNSTGAMDYNLIWKRITDSTTIKTHFKHYDAQIVSADYLIKNIDEAFETWQNSFWNKDIDFETFCNYILPYRVLNEPISDWRKSLNREYKHLIEGVECPRKAFVIIYHHVIKEFGDRSHKYPYLPDVVMLHKMQEGTCSLRCVYLISVLRSLGIPAAYDMVHFWANYSQGGHSWVAYVGNGGKTETMLETDSMPKEKNKVDSSVFQLDADVKFNPEAFQYKVDSLKRVSKIYRKEYQIYSISNELYSDPKLHFFNDRFVQDVSLNYGILNEVKCENRNKNQLFLCTFAAIKNWQPVVQGINKGKTTLFKNIGGDIVYLPVHFSEERMIPVENPFVLYDSGIKKTLTPDTVHKEEVVLKRKYLLFAHWINRWSKIIGSGIDGSNDANFTSADRLYDFTTIPDGITKIDIKASKPYRYIRFQAPVDTRPNIAEMTFYGVNHLQDTVSLAGNIICGGIDYEKTLLAFDRKYDTYTQTPYNNYWFGLDLKKKDEFLLTGLEFCMRHDMNMIEVGDNYELFYYDYGWQSLGKQIATCDSLIYCDVPTHALLWLKNHTKGREERIFTYENGKQIWW